MKQNVVFKVATKYHFYASSIFYLEVAFISRRSCHAKRGKEQAVLLSEVSGSNVHRIQVVSVCAKEKCRNRVQWVMLGEGGPLHALAAAAAFTSAKCTNTGL